MPEEWLGHILFTTTRWVHIVCTTLIVGGTLFFEFVVPIAIDDLKREQQLAVFGRARWVFKRVVAVSAVLLLASGAVSLYRLWPVYSNPRYSPSAWYGAGHVVLGILALGIAILLTAGRRPPNRQVGWMRVNLVILMVGIFAANVTRHIRVSTVERQGIYTERWGEPAPARGAESAYFGGTAPTTRGTPLGATQPVLLPTTTRPATTGPATTGPLTPAPATGAPR